MNLPAMVLVTKDRLARLESAEILLDCFYKCAAHDPSIYDRASAEWRRKLIILAQFD